MATGTLRFNVAEVETEDKRYVKAKVELTDTTLRVKDRRGAVLLDISDVQREPNGEGSFRYGDVVVTRMLTCGCGGTKIYDKETS